jgi:hypothetical protein
MGWSARKPVKGNGKPRNDQNIETLASNWKFGTAGDELQEVPSASRVVSGHDLDQVTNCFALNIESVISLDGLVQS